MVRFCVDSEDVATHNHDTLSAEEQIDVEPKVSGVKRAKNKDGCLNDTSKKNPSLDLHLGQSTYSSKVSSESEVISTHSHVTSSAEERIEMEPKISRLKRTKNKGVRGKRFRVTTSS